MFTTTDYTTDLCAVVRGAGRGGAPGMRALIGRSRPAAGPGVAGGGNLERWKATSAREQLKASHLRAASPSLPYAAAMHLRYSRLYQLFILIIKNFTA